MFTGAAHVSATLLRPGVAVNAVGAVGTFEVATGPTGALGAPVPICVIAEIRNL